MKRRTVLFSICLLAAIGTLATPRASLGASAATVTVPAGFSIETIAHIDGPRELAIASNGDLFVGTHGNAVEIVANATGLPAKPAVFLTMSDRVASGVTLAPNALYVGTTSGVWRIPYALGDLVASAEPKAIARVRPLGGRGHETTSVAVAGDHLYASVGSSCNACSESDPTRATIQEMSLDGTNMRARATHIRNAIALAVDPLTQALWAGVAGQDELESGHPYEIFDDITGQAGTPDYGWPVCYDNHHAVDGKRDCSSQAVTRVVFPAYESPIGAAFYHVPVGAAHKFPAAYRDGAFVALHGSWHTPRVPPRVVFVPIERNIPRTAVDWNDPNKQWRTFVGHFQREDGSRNGRPTGVAVAADGSLFVADDDANTIYRIRPIVSVPSRGS